MASINDKEETNLRGRVGGMFARESRIDEAGYPGDMGCTDALGRRMREGRIDQRHAIEPVGVSQDPRGEKEGEANR